MIFNPHTEHIGRHAFLSASKHHWINYDDEKLDTVFTRALAAQKGTALHDFAHQAITLGIKLPRTPTTLNSYVNDAIGFRMKPEQILWYSDNAFGTADAISFRKELLRIHDLKTGVTPTSFHQLWIYAAFFCLEYGVRPHDIAMEFRIYQNNEILEDSPDPEDIVYIMEKVKSFDRRINELRMEALA